MCGICGFTGEIENQAETIKLMTDVITHRGPDSEGFFVDKNIAMGFRRLSIIDVENGNQPIYNENNTLVITFNGEIYNYEELRNSLENHKFYTQTDTEVILHGFEEWGEDVVNKLRGMFAFSIWNRNEKSLFLARDYFGIKPLYFVQTNENFLYGSEIKSFLFFPGFKKKLNYNALDNYLSFQYSVPPETFFKNVFTLLPGHFMWYKDGNATIQKYYFEPKFEIDEKLTLSDAVRKIENVVENSVEAHKISDVEVGCFLSSGVDSSYIATFFPGQKAFTVGFDCDGNYNEIDFAKKLSNIIGLDHYHKVITPEEFWKAIKKVQYHMDQPLADPSCIALYFVSKIASEHVKVVLSGEGADEFFAGYPIYNEPRVFKYYQKFLPQPLRSFLAKIVKSIPFKFKGQGFVSRGENVVQNKFIGNAFIFSEEEKQKILKNPEISTNPLNLCRKFYKKAQKYDDVTQMQYLDINLWLIGDILLKADRMSMANSLELRVPFLDKEVFKVASSLPTNLKVSKENTKFAMRMAAEKHLPEEVAQKKKLGFPVPIRVWLREINYYNQVKEHFKSENAEKFFNTEFLCKLLDEHFYGKKDNSRKIWTVYIFLIWYNIYFEN